MSETIEEGALHMSVDPAGFVDLARRAWLYEPERRDWAFKLFTYLSNDDGMAPDFATISQILEGHKTLEQGEDGFLIVEYQDKEWIAEVKKHREWAERRRRELEAEEQRRGQLEKERAEELDRLQTFRETLLGENDPILEALNKMDKPDTADEELAALLARYPKLEETVLVEYAMTIKRIRGGVRGSAAGVPMSMKMIDTMSKWEAKRQRLHKKLSPGGVSRGVSARGSAEGVSSGVGTHPLKGVYPRMTHLGGVSRQTGLTHLDTPPLTHLPAHPFPLLPTPARIVDGFGEGARRLLHLLRPPGAPPTT